jgi:lysophospholipase L1-like esterase
MVFNNSVFASNKTPATILVLGDSLSGAWGIDTNEGWVALLQQHISKQGFDYRVINASVSGDTSRTGLSRIDAALQEHKPAIVIVALGGNDGLRGLAFSEIESSLSSIIERCQKNGARVLLSPAIVRTLWHSTGTAHARPGRRKPRADAGRRYSPESGSATADYAECMGGA